MRRKAKEMMDVAVVGFIPVIIFLGCFYVLVIMIRIAVVWWDLLK